MVDALVTLLRFVRDVEESLKGGHAVQAGCPFFLCGKTDAVLLKFCFVFAQG